MCIYIYREMFVFYVYVFMIMFYVYVFGVVFMCIYMCYVYDGFIWVVG